LESGLEAERRFPCSSPPSDEALDAAVTAESAIDGSKGGLMTGLSVLRGGRYDLVSRAIAQDGWIEAGKDIVEALASWKPPTAPLLRRHQLMRLLVVRSDAHLHGREWQPRRVRKRQRQRALYLDRDRSSQRLHQQVRLEF
jgi:hypothetical protein